MTPRARPAPFGSFSDVVQTMAMVGDEPAALSVEKIAITSAVEASMIAHARAEAPRECCGLLVGERVAEENLINRCVPTDNLEPGTARFLIDPAQHFALLKQLRGTRQVIVAAYHSHPRSAAQPSESDLAEASADLVHVIVSLVDPAAPDVRAYRIRAGRFSAMTVVRLDDR